VVSGCDLQKAVAVPFGGRLAWKMDAARQALSDNCNLVALTCILSSGGKFKTEIPVKDSWKNHFAGRILMKKNLCILAVVTTLSLGVSVALAKDSGPVSGTWSCVGHSTQSGDTPFTFTLTQVGEKVSGKFEAAPSDPSESAEKADITDGSYKDKKLDLHFDAYDGTIGITGSVSGKGQLSGNWTHSNGDQGTWECKKDGAEGASK
jgi:hypothetical protein